MKGVHKLQKENSRDAQGTNGQPMIHATAALLWSATGRIHNLQAPKLRLEDPRESELPNEWYGKCHVACKDKHTCIDKSEL